MRKLNLRFLWCVSPLVVLSFVLKHNDSRLVCARADALADSFSARVGIRVFKFANSSLDTLSGSWRVRYLVTLIRGLHLGITLVHSLGQQLFVSRSRSSYRWQSPTHSRAPATVGWVGFQDFPYVPSSTPRLKGTLSSVKFTLY
jgi:hypothetical protein